MNQSIEEMEAIEIAEEPYNANDPKQVNEQRRKVGRNKKERRARLIERMKTAGGRLDVFGEIECILKGNPMVSGDPYSTYFNLGQEFIARRIFKEVVKVCPDEFILMMKEHGINNL